MTKQEKVARIAKILDELHSNAPIPLDHEDPFTLLVAVMLSAQTTDKKVNEVTPALFAEASTPKAMAALPVERILAFIRQVGLAPTKAKNLKRMSELLLERHGGKVPADMEALEDLPGVGHKTASVVMCQAFGQAAFPVDTHIHRLAARWGLSDGSNVERTEADLKKAFPEVTWDKVHLQIIMFGRNQCPALRHDFDACPICSWAASGAVRKAARQERNAKVALKAKANAKLASAKDRKASRTRLRKLKQKR